MEDDKQEPNHSSRGNEWEVVSLTASTYAAAPNPRTNDSTYGYEAKDRTKEELDLSWTMSKSDFEHLVFPPSEHEDLPVNLENSEIYISEPIVQKLQMVNHEAGHGKIQEQWKVPALTDSDVVDNIKFFDKGKMLSVQKMELEEKSLYGLDSDYQGHSLDSYSSNYDNVEESAADENTTILTTDNPPLQNLSLPPSFQEDPKQHNYRGPLCEEWWRKQAASLYASTKETDIYWSIFIAASVVGLVYVGKKWRHEIWRIF